METLVHKYITAYNNFDIENMLALLSEDCIFENISNTGNNLICRGASEIRAVAEESARLFSSRTQTVTNIFAGQGQVATEIDYTATLAIDIPGAGRQGDVIRLRGVSLFTIANQKIVRIADYS